MGLIVSLSLNKPETRLVKSEAFSVTSDVSLSNFTPAVEVSGGVSCVASGPISLLPKLLILSHIVSLGGVDDRVDDAGDRNEDVDNAGDGNEGDGDGVVDDAGVGNEGVDDRGGISPPR